MAFNDAGSITARAAQALRPSKEPMYAICPKCHRELMVAWVSADYQTHCGHCGVALRLSSRRCLAVVTR